MSYRVAVVVCLVVSFAGGVAPAGAACDTTPPSLTGFGFSPSSINTTSAAQNVACDMTVTDDLAGVTEATCTFVSPTFLQSRSCTATMPSSGTATNGTFSCTISFPHYSASGTWTAQVVLADGVGNSQTIFPQFQALPFALTVTSNPDSIPPAMTTFVRSPTSVNVSASDQNVTCTMTVTDALSGVDVATCLFLAPATDQVQGCSSNTPATGTRNSGTFSCTFAMPRYSDAGTWTPIVFLVDGVGNFSNPPATGNLTVTASPEDIVAPSLTDFSFTPTSVGVGSAASTVDCTIGVSDATSGVGTATCTFTYTDLINPLLVQSQSCTATTPSSGTRNSGTFECSVTIPRYSAGGMWDADVELADLVGNTSPLPQPEQLTVDCSAGAAETTCMFTNKTTLTWETIAGATRYNVYRGAFSAWVDANLDHLPDGGYGVCRNGTDPNLTDTSFADTQIPTATQKGFYYLVSYTSGGIEQGLGSNSYGDPRTVNTPCP